MISLQHLRNMVEYCKEQGANDCDILDDVTHEQQQEIFEALDADLQEAAYRHNKDDIVHIVI